MKIKLTKEQLLPALKRINGIVDKKNTWPILYNAVIACDSDRQTLTLTATDMEIQVVCVISGVECDMSGSTTASARKLLDIVASQPSESTITLKTDDNNKLKVSSGKSRHTLATLDADDYPKFESNAFDHSFTIDTDKLKAALNKVASSMANGDIRYYLNGMMLSVGEDKVSFVSSDGHRMALCEQPIYCEDGISEVSPISTVILPRKAVLELIKTLPSSNGDGETVIVHFNSNALCVSMDEGQIQFSTKLVDSKYPSFDKVFTQAKMPTVIVNCKLLKDALKRAVILANEKFKGVEMFVSGDELTIVAKNPENEEANEVIECEYSGSDMSIAYNADYMIDVVSHINDESLAMQVTENMSAVIIEGDNVDGSDYKYVVMPMRM